MQAYIIMSQTRTFIFDKAQTTYDNDRSKWGGHKMNRKVGVNTRYKQGEEIKERYFTSHKDLSGLVSQSKLGVTQMLVKSNSVSSFKV